MKISVIICAAGRGERANLGKNKLLAPLYGAPVLYQTLTKFKDFDDIVVTASPQDLAEIAIISRRFGARVVIGGQTRTDSVYNALQAVDGDIVLIHDGARPFVTQKIIDDCINCVKEQGSAICALPATDTIVVAEDGIIRDVPERKKLFTIQTPQGFYLKDIKKAYESAKNSRLTFTDDGSVYSKYISPAHLFLGDECNKKLTYKSDFDGQYPAIKVSSGQAVGIGTDVHAFGKAQNFVTLCGEKIPNDSGLIAHSDGDAPVHAVMDAILSAAGLKDIGHYFPDTDEKFAGADSIQLLKNTVSLAEMRGYSLLNVSVTIQAEKPRLKPHIDAMVKNLALACKLPPETVAVSAGTCEHLGFVGEGLGICATAIVLLKRREIGAEKYQ
jgi:2-C-methyl-D-erythritol 4-phosphate cytidylyltransferase/2-C-methyl-D-erythritol 2,4-cyclodiphosphate synthase